MRVPLLKGRFFTDDDRQGSEPVVIINDAVARKHFPGEDPIGRMVQFLGTRRIVGVVGNIRHDGPETDWRHSGFRAARAKPSRRRDADPATLARRRRRAAGGQGRDLVASSPAWPCPRFDTARSTLSALIAAAALQHAAARALRPARHRHRVRRHLRRDGVHRDAAHAGDRHPDGARRHTGRDPVVGARQGRSPISPEALPSAWSGAWLLGALVAGFLFEIQPHDPWVYAGVTATLVATGITAAFLPARRAARVDPLVALRLE